MIPLSQHEDSMLFFVICDGKLNFYKGYRKCCSRNTIIILSHLKIKPVFIFHSSLTFDITHESMNQLISKITGRLNNIDCHQYIPFPFIKWTKATLHVFPCLFYVDCSNQMVT